MAEVLAWMWGCRESQILRALSLCRFVAQHPSLKPRDAQLGPGCLWLCGGSQAMELHGSMRETVSGVAKRFPKFGCYLSTLGPQNSKSITRALGWLFKAFPNSACSSTCFKLKELLWPELFGQVQRTALPRATWSGSKSCFGASCLAYEQIVPTLEHDVHGPSPTNPKALRPKAFMASCSSGRSPPPAPLFSRAAAEPCAVRWAGVLPVLAMVPKQKEREQA